MESTPTRRGRASKRSSPRSIPSWKVRAGLKAERNKRWFSDPFGRPVENSWHHRRWLGLAERHRFLLIEAAREHAKTQLFAITDPLVEIKANRNIRILIVSDVFEKSAERSRVLREHIATNEAYRAERPDVEIVRKNGDYEFTVRRDRILKEPTVRSTYAGGPISGGRYDRIICDDLVNWRLNSTTPEKRAKLRRWWHDEVMNSVAEGGHIVVIGTRQHHDDLYETIKADPRFHSETYPALDETGVLGYAELNEGYGQDDALCLWPAMHDRAELEAKREADEDSFLRQQQQVALPDTGLVYRRTLVDAALERGKAVEYDPGAAQFIGLDPGYGQRAAMLAIQERSGDRVELWAEHSFTQKDDEGISEVVVEHCAQYKVQGIYIDAEDPGLASKIANDLKRRGLSAQVIRVPFAKYKRLSIKTTRWLLSAGGGRVAWRAEKTTVHMPGRTTVEASIFRKEVRDYALREGTDDEPQKTDDHGPDAWAAYASRWIRSWMKATGQTEKDSS